MALPSAALGGALRRVGGSWGEAYSYKFNTGELKGPLRKAAAEAGWGWKGVAFGRL